MDISILLFILFLILQVGDVLITDKALEEGHREINPVVSWWMEKTGKWWSTIKIIPVMIAGWWTCENAWLPLLAFNLVYLYVCYRNHKIVKGV